MENGERKKLVWAVKKELFHLSNDDLSKLINEILQTGDGDPGQVDYSDEESCIDFVVSYMNSRSLLELEDEGVSMLLYLKDKIEEIKGSHCIVVEAADESPNPTPAVTGAPLTDSAQGNQTPPSDRIESQLAKLLSGYESLTKKLNMSDTSPVQVTVGEDSQSQTKFSPHRSESLIALKDLPLLQRREFKIQGGQIGDNASDISYSSISKQMDRGVKENHTENEVVQAVLRIIKPGIFKEMLTRKEEMSVAELKSFLQSHLGEKSTTELFQGLITAKQNEHETPQQFLYRMMGLKQKLIFISKQSDCDIRYEPQTIQNVFLHTIYQGLNERHEDIRRELKHFLSDSTVTDDLLLKQMTKTTNEESERKRRLGRVTRPKTASALSSDVEPSVKVKPSPESNAKDELIRQLSAQVQTLTDAIGSFQTRPKEPYKPNQSTSGS
ncbi:unnamed protein product [Knipowitschia caucasica]